MTNKMSVRFGQPSFNEHGKSRLCKQAHSALFVVEPYLLSIFLPLFYLLFFAFVCISSAVGLNFFAHFWRGCFLPVTYKRRNLEVIQTKPNEYSVCVLHILVRCVAFPCGIFLVCLR